MFFFPVDIFIVFRVREGIESFIIRASPQTIIPRYVTAGEPIKIYTPAISLDARDIFYVFFFVLNISDDNTTGTIIFPGDKKYVGIIIHDGDTIS